MTTQVLTSHARPTKTDMISKIEKGLINDDFIQDRITLKAYFDSGETMPCKLYNDGRLVGFSVVHHDFQYGGKGSLEYVEYDLDTQMVEEIKAKL